MSRVSILGGSQLSAAGTGLAALADHLENGLVPSPEWVATSPRPSSTKAPVLRYQPDELDDVISPRKVRRLDEFTKRFIYASHLAIEHAGIELGDKTRVGVVTGTAFAGLVTSFSLLDDIIGQGDDCGSPFKFAVAVNNASATSIASYFGTQGPCQTVLGFANNLINVLRLASLWLTEHHVDLVIAAFGDEYHPVIGYGLERLEGWSSDGHVHPLDFAKRSFVPAETYAAFVLAREGETGGSLALIDRLSLEPDASAVLQLPRRTPLLLAADGRPSQGATYAQIAAAGFPVTAYAALWGGNPSAEALTLASALVCLENETIFPLPSEQPPPDLRMPVPDSLARCQHIGCVAADDDGGAGLVLLSRP